MSMYTKRTEWAFEINDEGYAVHDIEQDGLILRAIVSETRNNGQEDTHQSAEIEWYGGSWKYRFTWGGESFDFYGNVSASQILKFLNENPLPEEALKAKTA